MRTMSEHLARAAIQRMHLSAVVVAPHYTGIAADLTQMALSDPEDHRAAEQVRRNELCMAFGFDGSQHDKPFAFSNGVAIIPVSGTLINRFGGNWGFVTGYNFIRRQMNLALADDDVKGIVFDLNSYGGMAEGCFELVDDIYAARGQKPMIGVIDANCYSGCYAIGSAMDKLYITPSGGAGSIGVLTMHVDISEALDKSGVKVSLIYAGKHKVDGNPFGPLPDDVRADIQATVDRAYDTFVSTVARNRNLDAADVRKTEARIYRAEDAVAHGLVDAIAAPSEAVQAFFRELSGSKTQEELKMTVSTQKPGGVADDTPQASTVDTAALYAEARKAERERISAIMSCEEAEGRSSLASHLALQTDMSVEAAKGILAAAPRETAKAPETAPATGAVNSFVAAMNSDQHPQVGADDELAGGGDDPGAAPHLRIIRAQEQATGQRLIEAK